MKKVASECAACHAPVASRTSKVITGPADLNDPVIHGGVTCDFCHSISGFAGAAPGNGNYVPLPDTDRKLGPFTYNSSWHHRYSALHTQSEFCGICHDQINRYGLEIKSTYTEWKGSPYAAAGIQCQDCHMNLKGYLTAGRPMYEKGQAAEMTLGAAPYRDKLFTHRFPGAHSKTQLASGMLNVSVGTTRISDREVTATILVNNRNTGHKMPSGSADLRLLWLEVVLRPDDGSIPVAAVPAAATGIYDVAGNAAEDKEVLGDAIPAGSRVYRAVFVDAAGAQTLSSYDAVRSIFDNRLNASEIREETYHVTIPAGLRGKAAIEARLKYLPYPESFTRKFGLEKPEPFELASARKVLLLK